MIKKLRIKLIFASMISLFAVLTIVLGIADILNYQSLVSDADSILGILSENDEGFPDQMGLGKETFPDANTRNNRRFSPELPYESRYFSVTMNSDGNVTSVNTGKIAAVDTAAAKQYGREVFEKGNSSGFADDYRYIMYTSGDEIHIIFLDCGRSLDSFRTFMITNILVAVIGLLAVLLILIFVSARIVKPFSENYEKQKRFITDAGHELKTPLTIIDADVEVLQMDFGENEWLSDIHNQTNRLADLTNSLILLSRMEEDQPKVEAIEFPLSDMAEESVAAFHSLARTQNKSLTSQISPMISMTGDDKAIRRLFTILLDNAVKYSNEKGEISLKLEKQKNQIHICVFNTADNISRENLPHLFDRFYRTDQSRNSQTGGYGLGLSIAAAIVAAHKGKIWASTQDGKSLLITITLPL